MSSKSSAGRWRIEGEEKSGIMIAVNENIALAESEVSYQFHPSSGPGGQNVNKVATAAVLRFDAGASPSLSEDVRLRLRSVAGKRMSSDGVIMIKAQRFRSQDRNREDALSRLVTLIRSAAERPRLRRATAPSRAAVARRLDAKTRRARTKQLRGPVGSGDG
jgi:ribosome-associated protein